LNSKPLFHWWNNQSIFGIFLLYCFIFRVKCVLKHGAVP
jgi:hypothetical protein